MIAKTISSSSIQCPVLIQPAQSNAVDVSKTAITTLQNSLSQSMKSLNWNHIALNFTIKLAAHACIYSAVSRWVEDKDLCVLDCSIKKAAWISLVCYAALFAALGFAQGSSLPFIAAGAACAIGVGLYQAHYGVSLRSVLALP